MKKETVGSEPFFMYLFVRSEDRKRGVGGKRKKRRTERGGKVRRKETREQKKVIAGVFLVPRF